MARKKVAGPAAVDAPLSSRAVLVRVSIEMWQATKVEKRASVVGTVSSAIGATKGRVRMSKLLVPEAAMKRMFAVTKAIRRGYEETTLPWGNDGMRIIPATQLGDFIVKTEEDKQQFAEAVSDFLKVYDEERRKARRELGDAFDPKDFKTVEEVRGRFKFRVDYMPVPLVEDIRADVGKEMQEQLADSMASAERDRMAHAMREVYYRLHGLIDNLHGQLTDPNANVHPKTYQVLGSMVKLLPDLNISGDKGIEEARKVLEATVLVHERKDLQDNASARRTVARVTGQLVKSISRGLHNLDKEIGNETFGVLDEVELGEKED